MLLSLKTMYEISRNLLILYALFDINYYLINAFLLYIWRRRHKIRPDESIEYYGICTTNDLDILFTHMNNARYLRELDFARVNFYVKSGLLAPFKKNQATILQSASNIRYRRPIPFLSLYKIITRMIYWDEKSIYLEHEFVTVKDGFIRAVVLSKQAVVNNTMENTNVYHVINKRLGKEESYKPEVPSQLEDWIELMKKSSIRYRGQNSNNHKIETVISD